MSLYRFTDSQARVYVDRALEVQPGDEVEWPDGPPHDGQWQPVDGASGDQGSDDAAQSGKKTPKRPGRAASSGE